MSSSLTVAVFAFNEAPNVRPVLDELCAWLRSHESSAEIIFVDDGSTDDTGLVAKDALRGFPSRVLRHETNLGIGAALKTAVRASTSEWITFLPADGQVPPEAIGELRKAAAQHHADVVLSVYHKRDDGMHRKILSWGVRALITAIQGVRLHSEGPYLFRRPLFVPDELEPDTFFLNFEFPIRAKLAGLSMGVAFVPCRPRLAGQSKSVGMKRIAGVAKDLWSFRIRRTQHFFSKALGTKI